MVGGVFWLTNTPLSGSLLPAGTCKKQIATFGVTGQRTSRTKGRRENVDMARFCGGCRSGSVASSSSSRPTCIGRFYRGPIFIRWHRQIQPSRKRYRLCGRNLHNPNGGWGLRIVGRSADNFNQGNIPFDVNYSTLTGLFFSGPSGLSFTFDGVANFLEGAILPNDLAIGGPGTLTLAGFDPTPVLFVLTTQGGGLGGFTTFSATVVGVHSSTRAGCGRWSPRPYLGKRWSACLVAQEADDKVRRINRQQLRQHESGPSGPLFSLAQTVGIGQRRVPPWVGNSAHPHTLILMSGRS